MKCIIRFTVASDGDCPSFYVPRLWLHAPHIYIPTCIHILTKYKFHVDINELVKFWLWMTSTGTSFFPMRRMLNLQKSKLQILKKNRKLQTISQAQLEICPNQRQMQPQVAHIKSARLPLHPRQSRRLSMLEKNGC